MKNKITELFDIKYPIIQGGMIWCSGWKLASAVSNAGGLGLIGSGSMTSDVLKIHIKKAKEATDKPFGINIPLLYPEADKVIQTIIDEEIRIVDEYAAIGMVKRTISIRDIKITDEFLTVLGTCDYIEISELLSYSVQF